jgi:hypothetical protein
MINKYRIQNYIEGKREYFDTEAEANARIKELEAQTLIDQAGRFSIIQSVESAYGVTLIDPSENSQEDGDYMVFNSNIGQYENIKGRTAAYARNQELKDAFIAELAQKPVFVEPPVQPLTKGLQEL